MRFRPGDRVRYVRKARMFRGTGTVTHVRYRVNGEQMVDVDWPGRQGACHFNDQLELAETTQGD